jgi:hypothetical protein
MQDEVPGKKGTPEDVPFVSRPATFFLKHIPQVLVVNVVMVDDLTGLDEGAQQPRTAIGCRLLQVGVTAFHVVAENR